IVLDTAWTTIRIIVPKGAAVDTEQLMMSVGSLSNSTASIAHKKSVRFRVTGTHTGGRVRIGYPGLFGRADRPASRTFWPLNAFWAGRNVRLTGRVGLRRGTSEARGARGAPAPGVRATRSPPGSLRPLRAPTRSSAARR